MKLALIAPGSLPIPPTAWGAVEVIVWQMKLGLEGLGHNVDVFNTRQLNEVIPRINAGRYDWVHCHTELFVRALNAGLKVPYVLTSHYGGFYAFAGAQRVQHPFNPLFEDSLSAPATIVLSERIAALYRRNGYRGFMRVLPNGIDVTQFRFAPEGNAKTICLGRLCHRKRQAWLADATRGRVAVDFVGPMDKGFTFSDSATTRYLGEWTRDTVYQHLTDYSCLVLLSDSEAAAPLVVLEALAAGLSVVVNEACADNLNREDFITILGAREQNGTRVVSAIDEAVAENARLRSTIRQYATDRLDVTRTVQKYVDVVQEFREQGQ